jgi:PKD repeat protein
MKKKLLSLMTMVFCALSFIVLAQNPPCSLKAKFDFKADKCKISFSDFSAAATGTTITSWSWDFGDATTSTLQNPTHVYTTSGTYTVCLTVIGNNGLVKCKDQFCLPVTVQGCEQVQPCGVKPLFKFKVDKCTVYFTDFSGTNAGTTITNWYWNFGDATTSTLQNPIHTYTAAGTYNVCLITVAVNTAGQQCKNEYCFPVKVDGCGETPFCKLAAKFDFKTDKCNVSFADLSAAGVGTTITNWFWDFGDATASTLQNPTHVYTTAGTYNVCLVIVGTNAAGKQCKDKICNMITVQGCGDIPACKLAAKFQFKTGKCKVGFSDLSAAGAGTTITNWFWDFGDATTSTLQNPTHVYTTAGTYTVCLTIVGNNGLVKCKDQFCLKVIVEGCGQEPCKLAAKFDFKADKCNLGFMDLSATGAGTTITNWYCDFGDATTSTLQNPTHIYATAGTYSVCLIIVGMNPNGEQCKDQFCKKIKVEGCGQGEPCKLTAKFDFKADKCKVGFMDLSVAGAGTTITNWYWDFGDATTSTLQNPTHVYTASATYNVCLIIVGINANGEQCKDQFCQKVTVEGCGQTEPCKLYPKFDFKQDSCNVYFADLSTAGPGTTITNWYWDFGDATTSTLQNPAHSYTAPGTYNVCLYVTGVNTAGIKCENKICLQVTVKDCGGQTQECKLYAKFDFKIDSCTVYFADFSGTGAGTTITNWYWDFGDGNTSTVQNPTHVYAASGTYTVCLTIVGANAAGQQCKDRICNTLTVQGCGQDNPCKVSAKFDYKIDGCGAYFTDYSVTGAGTTITSWFWDFGDGNTSTLQNPSHIYAAPGSYNVCLNVVGVNAAGVKCEDKICLIITVKDCGQTSDCKLYPKFDFKIDSCMVSFFDFSGTATGTTITSWYWDFGDGNTSSIQNPTHLYTASGNYTVCLLITGVNAAGVKCENKICLPVSVQNCLRPGSNMDKADASILAVYPNPANDVVNISFKMNVAGQVNISISDVQGRIVAVVKDGYYAYGYHNISWNVNVHAGWYLITIKTAEGRDQKQLLIQQ